jgi:outer membrane protein insertion porin family
MMHGVCRDTRREHFPPARGETARARIFAILCGVCCGLFVAGPWQAACAQGPFREQEPGTEEVGQVLNPKRVLETADEPIVDIKIEGNKTIPSAAIMKYVKTRVGRVPTPVQVRDDQKAMYETKWFFTVTPLYRKTDEGLVLVFKVLERPIVKRVEYRGNKKVSTKNLTNLIGLKAGSPYSVSVNVESAKRIEQHYHEKGFAFATVELDKGRDEQDREVVFIIKEGPKVHVTGIQFHGNEFFSSPVLRTKVKTKTRILWLIGGKYDPLSPNDDLAALKDYYQSLGFFSAKIENRVEFSKDKSGVTLHYDISEGQRYKIRNIEVNGAQIISEESVRKKLKFESGDYFNGPKIQKDVLGIKEKYGEMGRVFAKVDAHPVFLEKPGELDLVMDINEDRVYRIRKVEVVINGDYPHTKESVVLNQLLFVPGDMANMSLKDKSERRLKSGGYFMNTQDKGPKITYSPVQETAPGAPPTNTRGGIIRGQAYPDLDPELGGGYSSPPPPSAKYTAPPTRNRPKVAPVARTTTKPVNPTAARTTTRSQSNDDDDGMFAPFDAALSSPEGNPVIRDDERIVRAQAMEDPIRYPQNPILNNSPDGDPYGNRLGDRQPLGEPPPGWLDALVEATETQTGRIMFGVGVNSDAGVMGSAILDEQNFDITRFPTSFRDIYNGTAWRGGGQQFRIEAVPGNQLSRYSVSLRDPYFMDTSMSVGGSGFYFTRFYLDWVEQRSGGRIDLGQRFSNFLSGNMALRLENVQLTQPRVPNVPELQASLGQNFLSSIRFSLQHDTRDNTFIASEGHFLEGAYEQAFGNYDYSRFDMDARKYFNLYERPDGQGRHILSIRGQMSFTSSSTPIFERLYAGGFQSFRGFYFRGVTPHDRTVGTGGTFLALGSAEYMFPLTADEMLRGVTFTDFGTVDDAVTFNNFRMSVGAGLRITIPFMGPAPIALDLAYPLMKQPFDHTLPFSFYVGAFR